MTPIRARMGRPADARASFIASEGWTPCGRSPTNPSPVKDHRVNSPYNNQSSERLQACLSRHGKFLCGNAGMWGACKEKLKRPHFSAGHTHACDRCLAAKLAPNPRPTAKIITRSACVLASCMCSNIFNNVQICKCVGVLQRGGQGP